MHVQNVSVCTGTTRTRVSTVLNGHAAARSRVIASSAYPILPTWGYHLAPEVHQRKSWILHIFSLRKDREQHVPDSSNHSLCLVELFSFSCSEGNFDGNQLPDGSIGLSPSPSPLLHHHHNDNDDHHDHNNTQHNTASHTTPHGDRDRERRQRKRRRQRDAALLKLASQSSRCWHVCLHTYRHTYIYIIQSWIRIYSHITFVWVQTGHSACTCTVTLHVIEPRTNQKFESSEG